MLTRALILTLTLMTLIGVLIESSLQRRGAFDIGSGTIKLQVSDVRSGQIVNHLFGEEVPCAFGADSLKSSDANLSNEISTKGMNIIHNLKSIADKLGVESYTAIATAVFRRAPNGDSFLEKVRSLGVPVKIVSQIEEAEIG